MKTYKELIELAAQSATIEQLNVVIKAGDMRISELEKQLSIANIEIKDLKQRLKTTHNTTTRRQIQSQETHSKRHILKVRQL